MKEGSGPRADTSTDTRVQHLDNHLPVTRLSRIVFAVERIEAVSDLRCYDGNLRSGKSEVGHPVPFQRVIVRQGA